MMSRGNRGLSRLLVELPLGVWFAVSLEGCGGALVDTAARDCEEARLRIEILRNDPTLYYGEAWARIEPGRLAEAREEAERRARASLEANIEVHVRSFFKAKTQGTNERLEQEWRHVISQVAGGLLKDVRSECFPRCPDFENCWAVAWVSKKMTDESMAEERRNRMRLVVGPAAVAVKDLAREPRNYSLALSCLAKARRRLEESFPGRTFEADLDEDGASEDVRTVVETRFERLLGALSIEPIFPRVSFDRAGQLLRRPAVRVWHQEAGGNPRSAVAGLGLRARMDLSGSPVRKAKTGPEGSAEFDLDRFVPLAQSVQLLVELDLDPLSPAGEPRSGPSCSIQLVRLPALWVTGGTQQLAAGLEAVLAPLAEGRFELTEPEASGWEMKGKVIQESPRPLGGDRRFFTVKATVELELIRVSGTERVRVYSGSLGPVFGRGTTSEKASTFVRGEIAGLLGEESTRKNLDALLERELGRVSAAAAARGGLRQGVGE